MAENLFCPRCSCKFTPDTRFCRKCGLALDGINEIVNGDAENAPKVISEVNFGVIRLAVFLFILGTVIGLLNAAIKDLQLFPQVYGKMVCLALIAAAFLCFGGAVIFPTKKYAKRNPDAGEIGREMDAKTAPLAGELVSSSYNDISFPADQREPVVAAPRSVTEHTTRNLN